jgi:predicted nucleic acid-binding Zn ribbon protein
MGSVTPLQRLENLERLVMEHEEWQRRTSEAELAREARREKRANSRMYKVVSLVMVVLSLPTRAPRARVALGRRPSTNAHETR